MKVKPHNINNVKIAELISDDIIINSIEDGANLMADLYFQEYDKIIIQSKNITTDFFDLKNGIAGEILQKFSNYRMRLTIVGDFTQYTSKSIQNFIFESNKKGHIRFVNSISEALK